MRHHSIFRRTYKSFSRHNPSRFGAALSFYLVFTIGPALLITISAAARIWGRDVAERRILQIFGSEATSAAVGELVRAAATPYAGWLATSIGFLGLFFGLSGMYRQIRDALRTIWHIDPVKPAGLFATIIHRLTSIATVLAVSIVLFLSVIADATISMTGKYAQARLYGGEGLWHAVQLSLSTIVLALLFAAIFRYVPRTPIRWHDVALGAIVTAVLFVFGKFLLGLYLGKAAVGSRYGPAGSVIVVMVWAYWSAQIFFFGLELTHVYSAHDHDEIAREDLQIAG
ncbi:MAG: rane protein [Thermoanaerobaculia bacterium]|jgi:membrane protein|nr:rane protein [Thermoanaerobaculia bacterium]